MSVSVVSAFSGTDKRIVLSNSAWAGVMSIGSYWSKLRIGIRYCVDDTGSNILAPPFFLGVLANPSSGLANGPLITANTSNFFGAWSGGDASVTRSATGGVPSGPYYTDVQMRSRAIAGGVATSGILSGYTNFSATPSVRRGFLIVEITKGSPNWTLNGASTYGSTVYVRDYSEEELWAGMTLPNINTVRSYMTGATLTYAWGNSSVAVDESLYGYMNSVCVGWGSSAQNMYVSEVAYAKLA